MAKEALMESVIMPSKFPKIFTGMYMVNRGRGYYKYELCRAGEEGGFLCMSCLNLHSHQVFVL